jgi:hypothetical protein
MGATAEGRKELIAVIDGVRESKQSWQELLIKQPLFCKCRDERAGHLAFMFR